MSDTAAKLPLPEVEYLNYIYGDVIRAQKNLRDGRVIDAHDDLRAVLGGISKLAEVAKARAAHD